MFRVVGGVIGVLGATIGTSTCVSCVCVAVHLRFAVVAFHSSLSPLSPLFRSMVVARGYHLVWCGWLGLMTTWSLITGLFIVFVAVVDRDDQCILF